MTMEICGNFGARFLSEAKGAFGSALLVEFGGAVAIA